MTVNIGEVTTFANPKPDKPQALKVLEESAEVFSAWEDLQYAGRGRERSARHKEGRKMSDTVSKPAHYTQGGIECKDAIKAALTDEEYRGWVKGNAMAYIWRERFKNGDEDIAKAVNMLSWLEVG